jgi:hypothetical protein
MKRTHLLLTILLFAPVAFLDAADSVPGSSLKSRGLPRILFNNDSDDLKWPAK